MAKKYGDKDYGRGTMKDSKSNVLSMTLKDIKQRADKKHRKQMLYKNRKAPKKSM